MIHEASTASADTRLQRAVSLHVRTLSRRTIMNNAGQDAAKRSAPKKSLGESFSIT
jgi:hypothetical protein